MLFVLLKQEWTFVVYSRKNYSSYKPNVYGSFLVLFRLFEKIASLQESYKIVHLFEVARKLPHMDGPLCYMAGKKAKFLEIIV